VNNGKVCVSVCAETADELISRLRAAEHVADIIEIRFDCLRTDQIRAALSVTSTCPIIATFRAHDQGGVLPHSLSERLEFWREAAPRYWAVDLEQDLFGEVCDASTRILSFHDFALSPVDIGRRIASMQGLDPNILKVAVRARDAVDAIPVWDLLKSGVATIPIAMGEAGKWTRILGLAYGACLTYAALEAGGQTADGQIAANELIELYRVKELTRNTRVFGVIGDPVSSSLSPYIHNPAFRAAGLDSVFLHLEVKDLDAFLRRMVKRQTREVDLNFGGFSVTMPHKQAIMSHLDEIDPVAEKVGAVNTVKVVGDRLIGFNTDAEGFIKPINERLGDIRGARTVVAGAGGAARAVTYALIKAGADVTIIARNGSKAAELATEFHADHGELQDASLTDVDVLVNATPVGMRGPNAEKKLFAAAQLTGVKFICDLVTSVADTPLLREAKNARIPAIGGMEMLLAQAELQFEIWTGVRPKTGVMRRSLLERMRA
jgi:3-dehydroquinate dehydratase/shikimate dehydrogenase